MVCTLFLRVAFAVNKNRRFESLYRRRPARKKQMRVTSAIKIHGGKHYLASRIVELLPPRDGERPWHLWREAYFGSGAVTLALDPEGLSEAVNDIHHQLMNFWSTLQQHFEEFQRRVSLVPFSEEEFARAKQVVRAADLEDSLDAIDRSVCFFVACRQSRQGLMRDFATPTRRLRRGMNENVSAWLSAIEGLPAVYERLRRVELRNMDAIEFIRKYDDPAAVFYLDPPYLHATRSTGGGEYVHELSERDHAILLATISSPGGVPLTAEAWAAMAGTSSYDDFLAAIDYRPQGRFLLSGYPSRLYETLLTYWGGWRRVDFEVDNKASSRKTKEVKIESVWMNYPAGI